MRLPSKMSVTSWMKTWKCQQVSVGVYWNCWRSTWKTFINVTDSAYIVNGNKIFTLSL